MPYEPDFSTDEIVKKFKDPYDLFFFAFTLGEITAYTDLYDVFNSSKIQNRPFTYTVVMINKLSQKINTRIPIINRIKEQIEREYPFTNHIKSRFERKL